MIKGLFVKIINSVT